MDEDGSRQSASRRFSSHFGLPRLTPSRVLALLGGAVAVQMLPGLPPTWISVLVAGLASTLLFLRASNRAPIWFVLGLAWTLLRAHAALDARLPTELHGRDFDVVGTIHGLPEVQSRSTRFAFDIESATLDGERVALQGLSRLNWYDHAPELPPCSRWQLRLRLRPPRGLVNPGGYDSERGAVQRGVVAVGYVRDAQANHLLDHAPGICIDQWRGKIANAISHRLGGDPASALLRALAVGDQQGIDDDQWQVLRATGIGHLIAISGLHVGMLAAFGALLARLLWKAWPRLTLRIPGPLLEAPVAMACATGYGLLAGMGVPTMRTLLMIAIALLARFTRRSTSMGQGLALAALAIVAWDPLAVLSAGFWLSFVGVAVLLSVTRPVGVERVWWREIPRLQLILSLALLPMSVWFFGQGSLIGPLANLIAVPWVSLLVVPITVAGSLLIVDVPTLGGPLLELADVLLKALWQLMQWMAALPSAQIYFAAAPIWAFVLALLGVGWMLMPRGVPLRLFGLALLVPMLIPRASPLATGEFEVWMFDVGQGLSMFVRTREHTLLYDAGPRYPSGFDIGDAVVIPSLHALGSDHLDRMLISHGDSDHAGGAKAVHLAFPEASIESGEPERLAVTASACRSGESWVWDEVSFRIVSAPAAGVSKSNDRSCVVLVSGASGSLLLTGDATSHVEPEIAEVMGKMRISRPLVLSVPHHGSKTATSAQFLDAIDPQLALVSAGYRNHFGHPHGDVKARLAERGIALLNTADAGYLYLRFGPAGGVPELGREARLAWWRMH
ncbi:MAG TPA: DNA internalization-related competence protein ComEC/Rec2 [Dokdonella sp.]|uniref:DNA internalization-related competence protein ComEC/Rec2 n=1 Tax=Dokdonella sp. TaxID=2291710 RepID=UPI002D810AB6|nr:DNA internalization-related competence protein ComEC/Rec2 [Dokdonella sp.]HET9034490.1 DNA internalization-related competence protein ComEC/Rec2 [Dokdonella sp.]